MVSRSILFLHKKAPIIYIKNFVFFGLISDINIVIYFFLALFWDFGPVWLSRNFIFSIYEKKKGKIKILLN